MKFAFSTVGCPDWSWSEILAAAKDLGYDGVEIRGIGGQMNLPRAKELTGTGLEHTLTTINRTSLSIPCLASSCILCGDGRDQAIADAKEYIDLAKALQTPYVRVLGDANPEAGVSVDVVPEVISALQLLGQHAASTGVWVLLETNGIFANSKLMREVMASLTGLPVGVLWDVHHPYRYFGEAMADTWSMLKDYIRHIHVKDSRSVDDKVTYTLMGQGDVPVADVLALISESGYGGWVSLEWVKRWRRDLEEPGLVFPHFIEFVRKLK